MVILRAIGNFFARIGRWIKNTAWIQPLLIVGSIFGIIFAIPHITEWVGEWYEEKTDAEKYYRGKEIDLEGAQDGTSKFDSLLKSLANGDEAVIKATYGEKFFLAFVQEECSDCEARYGGFKLLEDSWGKDEFNFVTGEFKLHTVFIDDVDEETEEIELFKETFNRNDITTIFEETCEVLQDGNTHPYALNNSSGVDGYKVKLENTIDPEQFVSPTVVLVDLSTDAPIWTSASGISEILFSFEGGNEIGYARTLANAWESRDIFSPTYKK